MKKGERMSDIQKKKLIANHKGMSGLRHSLSTIEKIKISNKGKKHKLSQDGLERLKKSHIGISPINKGKKWNEWMSEEGQNKAISHLRIGQKGKNHWNWKGGVHTIKRPRDTFEYRLWRKWVFERDKYTCIWCGEMGGKLQADHIKAWVDFPELRFAIDNGRTLCVPCHKTTDTYGFNLMWKKRSEKIKLSK